eukprot:Tamp_00169.p1 GENE.Tamp_00169~~Tamp_00169.p1  ORF type:complete len:3645 (+),score=1200.53 Tamp_00169:164-10936(+)
MGSTSADPAALIVALFKFNEISIEDGYIEADQDEDGQVSEADLVGFCRDLQLGCPDDDVRAFFKTLDPQGTGFIEEGEWTRALQAAEQQSESVLETRGVSSKGVSTTGPPLSAGGPTTEGSAVTDGVARDVDSAADQLAAALVYNELTLEEAFEVLDKDEDERISMEDLRSAAGSMGLKVEEDTLVALHKAMDEGSNGLIELDAWCTFLKGRNTSEVLRSRGVDESQLSLSGGVAVPVPLEDGANANAGGVASDTPAQNVSDLIAALLDYNNLSNREGFEAFDVDEDDLVSMSDLMTAAGSMNVDASEADLTAWFHFFNRSGSGKLSEEEWNAAMDAANSTDVLASRGVVLVEEPAAPGYTATDVDTAACELAAALRYNNLSPRSGFESLDVDEDDRISMGDLQAAVEGLALQISPEALAALHKAMDQRGDGLIQVDSWTNFLEGRNTDSVLLSRGVDTSVEEVANPEEAGEAVHKTGATAATEETPLTTSMFAHVQPVSDTIAALLDYNYLNHEDGFEAFDVDQDDKISMQDATTAAESLKLDVTAEALAEWFRAVNRSADGMITFAEWDTALGFANSEDVLRSRGVLLTESEGVQGQGQDAPPASAVPDPAVPPLTSAANAPEPANSVAAGAPEPEQESSPVQPAAEAPATQPQVEAPAAQPKAELSAGSATKADSVAETSSLPPTYANLSPRSAVQRVTNTIAALLQYSELSAEEGFGEFDKDEDGILSYKDLLESSTALDMEFAEADLERWYQSLGAEKTGGVTKDVWCATLSSADAEGVLKSRGVILPSGKEGEAAGGQESEAAGLAQGDAPAPPAPAVAPQEVSNLLAALLKYNGLPFADAFEDFDQDEDGKISRQDFDGATAALEWDEVPVESLQAWHSHFNKTGDGFMTREEWLEAFESADADTVLASRGVATEGTNSVSGLATDVKVVMRVAEVVAACLQHNELGLEDGFYAFDIDENEILSIEDLVKAANELELQVEAAELQEFLTRVEELGGGKESAQQMAGWKKLLEGVDGTHVLKSRGVLRETPPQPETGAPPPPPAAAVEAPVVPETTDSAAVQAPAQALPDAPEVVASAPPAEVGPAAEAAPAAEQASNPASATAPEASSSAAAAQETPAAVPQAQAAPTLAPEATVTTIPEQSAQAPASVEPAPAPATAQDKAAAPAAAPDSVVHTAAPEPSSRADHVQDAPAEKAQSQHMPAAPPPQEPAAPAAALAAPPVAPLAPAAPAAPAQAGTAAPTWEDAVPFTLTLDVDFATIGNHEDFKQGVLADVAAAANVDVKYVKIQGLRAGSVIVDLLIAPEVGEPHKVVQDLEQQVNSPGSRLLTGKLTSKTKALVQAPAASSGAPAQPEAVPSAPAAGGDSAERARLENELASARADLDALKTSSSTRVAELEAEVEHLTEQLDTESFSHNDFRKTAEAHVAELETEVQQLNDKLETARAEHEQAQKTSAAHIEQLNSDVQRVSGEFEAAKALCVELEAQLAQAKSGAPQEAAAAGKEGAQGDAVPAPEVPAAEVVGAPADLAKEIEMLTQQLTASKEQLHAQELVTQKSLDHVKALEQEVEALKKGAGGAEGTTPASSEGDADDAGLAALDKENKVLKEQVNSLTFQLQELQGAMADTPREMKAKDLSATTGGGSGKKLLEPPPSVLGTVSPQSLSRTPSTSSQGPSVANDKTKRSLLEPPSTNDVFPAGDGRRSAPGSRRPSPERLAQRHTGAVSLSPPTSPSNSNLESMTMQRDDALAKFVKAQQELAELRASCAALSAALEEQTAGLKAAELERQVSGVVRGATEAALGERVAELEAQLKDTRSLLHTAQEELSNITYNVARAASAHTKEMAQYAAKSTTLAGAESAGPAVVAAASPAALAAPAPDATSDAEAAQLRAKVQALVEELGASKREVADLKAAAKTAVSQAPQEAGQPKAAQLHDKVQALEEELAARNREMADLKAAAQTADVQAAAATKQAAVLEAQLASLKTQASESQRLSEEAAAGQGQTTHQLQAKLAEALATVSGQQTKVGKLEEQVQKLTESLDAAKAESNKTKKEKLELISQVEEAARIQRTSSVEAEQEAQTLKTAAHSSATECDRLKAQVQALEVQVAEMRGKETALQEQLSAALADLAAAKDSSATLKLDQNTAVLETTRLLDAQTKLQSRMDELVAQKAAQDTELAQAKQELAEFNGTRYSELESLKAKVEILRQEKDALVIEKNLLAAGKSLQRPESQGAAAASSIAESPQRSRHDDAYFGAMEADLAVSSGALSTVQEILKFSPLADVESEIRRVHDERVSSPHKARPVSTQPPSPPPPRPREEFFDQWQTSSPSRRARQTGDLQEKLDLLAAALSYNGLTVVSGYSAFDQDRDGRVSEHDLRKSLSDLELAVGHEELRMLFNFMDADGDGFISEVEWSTALRDADPFSVLASQGVRTLDIKVPQDANAHTQAMDAFESIKQELAKSLAAQARMKSSLDQAQRGRAELEEDLRRIRQTRSDLEAELRSVRSEMVHAARASQDGARAEVRVADNTAELSELRRCITTRDEEISKLRQQLETAQVTTNTTVVSSTSTEELEALRAESRNLQTQLTSVRQSIAAKESQVLELTAKCARLESASVARPADAAPPAEPTQTTQVVPAETTAELEKLRRSVGELTSDQISRVEREKMLADELRAVKDSVAERESTISQLKARIADLEKAELSHASQLNDITGKYTQAQELFEKACAERDAVSSKIKSAEIAEAQAKTSLEHQSQDLLRVETELKALQEQMKSREETSNRMVELQARVTAREADVAKLKEAETTAARELARIKGELDAQKELHGTQIAEIQALAKDAKLCAIEREHKLQAQDKLKDAQVKIQELEEQIEQLHVLRASDESRSREAANASVQDLLAEKESELQRAMLQLEEVRGDLEAARRDREAMVARQTQSLQDELLRVNAELKAREIQVVDLEQLKTQLQAQVDSLQAAAASKVDGAIVEEWKRSAALKEAEIEELRRNRNSDLEALRTNADAQSTSLAKELEQARAHVATMSEERNVLDRRVKAVTDELTLSREENDNLKRQVQALREGKQSLDSDVVMLRSKSVSVEEQLRTANAELEELRATCDQLREAADQCGVMRERVRAADAEVALANTRLEQLEALQRDVERKGRDLVEERERYDRLRAELQDARGGGGARGEWESKNSMLENRLAEVEALRRQAEFDLTRAGQDRSALDAKLSEMGEELANARVRITSLESSLKVAQQGGSESSAMLEERIRDLTSSKERYERKYRETQAELKEVQEQLARSGRRVQELQEALDSSIGPNDSEALRRAEETAARERQSRKAVQAQLDAMNAEYQRLKDSHTDSAVPSATGPSDTSHLQLRVRSLLRENAECHAQIRLLGAEVVGLSEALEIVTKRAHDGESRQAQIQSQVEYVTKGVASGRALRPATKGSSSRRSTSTGRAARARSPNAAAYSEHERNYYPNELYPSRIRTPPPQRPSSADMRRRPASAGRRPASARERGDDVGGGGANRNSRDFQAWLETDRVSGSTVVGRTEAWGASAGGGGRGSMMPKLPGRDRDAAMAIANTRDEVYYGAAGRKDARSP